MVFERSGPWKTVVSLALLCVAGVAGAAPGVRSQVDRNSVSVGESFAFSIIIEDMAAYGAPSLPPIPGVNVSGPASRNEIQVINGQQSSKQVFDYQLLPTQPGDIVVPSVAVQAGGKVFTTQPIQVKVLPAGSTPGSNTNLALLRLVVPKKEVYLGEAFPVELYLYWQNAQDLHMPQIKAPGFSTGQFGEPQRSSTVMNGMQYNVMVFRTAATAARTGDLTLGPAECQLTVLVPVPGQPRRRGIFDEFFGGPAMQGRPTLLQTDSQPMRVLPLPTENVPENFNGAVGTYNLTMSAGPSNLVVGDPITVRVQISGRGQLDALNLPPQPQWREFKAYAATSTVNPTDPLGLSGSKNFEQVIVPENHEIRVLPPFQFSFFDPSAKSYRTLQGPAIPLTIRPSISAAAPPVPTNATTEATPPTQDDIIHIRARLEPIAVAQPPLVRQPWFLGLQAFPAVAWLGLFIARKRKEKLANNPRLRRKREAAARIRAGLRDLPEHAAARRTEEFFAAVFRLLQEQLGAQLDMPASGITEAVIENQLRNRNIPESTLAELHELFLACNQARYAPQRTSEELSSYIPRVEAVLRNLESVGV
jgi:BatD DUF11 like domain